LKIAIIAGELSGDALGAGLLRALSELCPKLTAEGVVGPAMRAAGCGSLAAIERLSVMGLVEVLGRLPELLRLRRKLLRHFLSDPPDVFVGIDAPDFNLGLARRLREHGIPTVQYVSPTVWAWRQGRIRGIARSVDLMLTLFPFEERFYQQQGIAVRCVGHPLADEIPDQVAQQPARAQLGLSAQARVLALLPGSRMGEVQRLAADMLAAAQWVAQRIPDLRVVIPCATDQIQRRLTTLVDQSFQQLTPQLVRGNARQVMAAADSVLVASGTATLETALVKRPMVVVYRMNRLSYMVLRRLLKVPYVAMPNLLAGECLAPEFLQEQVRAELVGAAVLRQLDPDTDHTRLLCRYRTLHQELRRNADRSAAEAVLQLATART
jgi:lipid-A-disaccharide synthase